MALPVPTFEDLLFKDESEFRYIGKGEVQIYDLHDITTGKAIYGADVSLPGQKYAVIAAAGGRRQGQVPDSAAALAVPGVEKVIEIPSSMPPAKFAPLGGVAVVANSTWAALQGRDALQIEWDDGPHAVYNTEQYHKEMSATAVSAARDPQPGRRRCCFRERGQGGQRRVLPAAHGAHRHGAPVALVNVADGKVEVWGRCRARTARARMWPTSSGSRSRT